MLAKISKYLNKDTGKNTAKRMLTNDFLKKNCKFEDGYAAKISQENLYMDELWDVMHGIFTNSDRDPSEFLSRYSGL